MIINREIKFRINYKKLVNVILYVVEKSGGSINKHNLMEILFEADKQHMQKHIRPVTGDRYIKTQDGTVPVETLNILNGSSKKVKKPPFKFIKEEQLVVSQQKAYRGCLSKTDIWVLDSAIAEYAALRHEEIKQKIQQDECWKKTPLDKQINYEDMITDNEEIVEYLQRHSRTILL